MREVIKQGATIEQAVELALKELNLTKEQVTCEVLEYPEKKFLFRKKAKVKVVEIEETFDVKNLFEQPTIENNKQEKNTKDAEPQDVLVKQETEKTPSKQNIEENQQSIQIQQSEKEKINQIEISQEEYTPKVKFALDFIDSVICQFYEKEYSHKVFKTQTGYLIKIVSEDAGCLIGKKGETMQAISYLTSLAANRFEDSAEKITVDVADYREKREKDLQELAKKIAKKVAKTGRNYTFEPMNPYERRIIHSIVGEIDGVKSESRGEGSQRRVVVYSLNARKNRGNYSKSYKQKERTEKSETSKKNRQEKLVDEVGSSLYSKIEL